MNACARWLLCGSLAFVLQPARPGIAAEGEHCWPIPSAADSIRVISPSDGKAPRTTDVIIAVLPPGQDVAAAQMFSAQASVGTRHVPLWVTIPTPVDDPSQLGITLLGSERAWRFRVVGAPAQAVVTILAARYLYGVTRAEHAVDCRMFLERVMATYSTP
ncbi:MAG: hypothetical protein JWO85_1729 [Candidatus Eremiobacteraeota bacterium]|nr:hypothetical protein [Candidatus Eremiobacteraeota bacterium]